MSQSVGRRPPSARVSPGPPARTVRQAGETRSASVESLRAIGAIGVVASHIYQTGIYSGDDAAPDPVHTLILTAGSGYALLLVLSGYLLFRPFARRMLRGESLPLGRYARNRALRVLPLYYISVVLILLTIAPAVGWDRWLVLLSLTGNFVPGSYQGVNTPLLVLLVEVQFYLLLPVLVAGLRRRPSMRFAALVIAGLSIASIALRLVLLNVGGLEDPERFVRASVLTMFHLFGAGMLLALLALRMEDRLADTGRRPAGWLGSANAWLAAAVAVWLAMYATQFEPLSGVASVLLLGAVTLPLRQSRIVGAFAWRPLVLVGIATFSVYMWHLPIAQTVASSGWAPPNVLGLFAVCLPLIAIVTVVSYALIEVPALSLRLPWSAGRTEPGVATATTTRAGVVVVRLLLGAVLIGAMLAALDTARSLGGPGLHGAPIVSPVEQTPNR